ncbi:hypothetical protein [Actinoplanes sp. NPDC049265]|uniref:hypothetical protein n=1 Tax=Actinoplanes sp. NPDC049265 TaxID=3363902 RepID=UPI00371493CF
MLVLSGAAATGGLLIDGLYPEAAVAAAAFRGNDLATMIVGMPALTLAVIGSIRGSLRAHLAWIGMLAYSIYNLAYYVFGAQFNDLFLLHVAAFVSSVFAFGLALTALDVTSVDGRSAPRTPVRWISVLLALPAAAILVLYSVAAVRFAITGQQPSDVLPMPSQRVHLAYALDLTLLVPAVALAAVQLWRRTAWGYALGTAACLAVGVYQLNYIIQKIFVAEAGVAGVTSFDPRDLPVPAVLLSSATVLLLGLRKTPTKSVPAPTAATRTPGT